MNYLAHAYLSFNDAAVLTGNMISDFVKGKAKFNYPAGVQNGILLHRAIDTYTDQHPATSVAKDFFRLKYRLYSGAFVDVVYDHFLALDAIRFEEYGGLKNFSVRVYAMLESNFELFPERFQRMFPYMESQNWLYNYRFKEGIQQSFGGLMRRARYIDETASAFGIFNKNYDALQECYHEFFPEVLYFTRKKFNEICSDGPD
ncbi:MAG TPA: ACP phosphodiesterase [Chitinophagaceae bacterium]|nr:ACP phosphodiesterase [Chitinophagaceae bacterium]